MIRGIRDNKELSAKHNNSISKSNSLTGTNIIDLINPINLMINIKNNNSWNHVPFAIESSIPTHTKNTSKFVKRCSIKRENSLVVKNKGVLVTKKKWF